MANSTVLSTTCPCASTEPLPGGSPGPKTNTTISVMIRLETSHSTTKRRKWFLPSGLMVGLRLHSYDLEEAAHVADRLHRAAVALDEPGAARHEALPAVKALARRAEREGNRVVIVAQRA